MPFCIVNDHSDDDIVGYDKILLINNNKSNNNNEVIKAEERIIFEIYGAHIGTLYIVYIYITIYTYYIYILYI